MSFMSIEQIDEGSQTRSEDVDQAVLSGAESHCRTADVSAVLVLGTAIDQTLAQFDGDVMSRAWSGVHPRLAVGDLLPG